jgi:hypothetical protein
VLVPGGKPANGIADFLPPHAFAVELGAHVQKRPLTGLRPIDLVALRIELATVLGHQADTDQINGVRLLDELGVDPIFHVLPLTSRNGNRNTVDKADKRPEASVSCAIRRPLSAGQETWSMIPGAFRSGQISKRGVDDAGWNSGGSDLVGGAGSRHASGVLVAGYHEGTR